MKENAIPERMREIEIFGVPALFTSRAIPPETVYPGMFRYELQTGSGQRPHCLAEGPGGKFLGTVLTPSRPHGGPPGDWAGRAVPGHRGRVLHPIRI